MRVVLTAIALVLLVSCSSNHAKLAYTVASSPDWLTPRANPANSGQINSGITNEPYTVAWSVKTGGVASSEPIVKDGLLFFSGLDRRIEVYNLATGQRLFRKRFDGPVLGVIPGDTTFGVLVDQIERRFFTFDLRTGRVRKSFRVAAANTPPRALNDTSFIFGSWSGHVICRTYDGHDLWNSECQGPIKSAPAIKDSVIYVSSGHSIFALSAITGVKIWEHSVGSVVEAAPAASDAIYFAAADSFVTALDPASGDAIWTVHSTGRVFATPTVGRDLLYIASNDGLISALNKRDGKVKWTYNTGAIADLSPTLSGDYLLATSRQSVLSVLNATVGETVWSDTTLSAQAMTPPIVVGSHIIVTDSKRRLICLAPATQQPLTKSPVE